MRKPLVGEPPGLTPSIGSLRDGIVDQAKRVREDCDYSSQRHFNTGAFFKLLHYAFGVGVAVLGSLGGAALLAPQSVSLFVGGVSSIGAAALVGVSTALSPGESASSHYRAGNEYLGVRKDATAFLELDVRKAGTSDDALEGCVRVLKDRAISLDRAYSDLYTPQWAYRKAKDDIRRGQTRHLVDRRR
jgi:hypothetical protein